MIVDQSGPATLTLFLAPTLDTLGKGGLSIGVSVDDQPVQPLTARLEATGGTQDTPGKQAWAEAVHDNLMRLSADLESLTKGRHVVRIWRLDDNVVLEKIVLATVPVPPSYLGPSTA